MQPKAIDELQAATDVFFCSRYGFKPTVDVCTRRQGAVRAKLSLREFSKCVNCSDGERVETFTGVRHSFVAAADQLTEAQRQSREQEPKRKSQPEPPDGLPKRRVTPQEDQACDDIPTSIEDRAGIRKLAETYGMDLDLAEKATEAIGRGDKAIEGIEASVAKLAEGLGVILPQPEPAAKERIAELEGELDRVRAQCDESSDAIEAMQAKLDSVGAENAQLLTAAAGREARIAALVEENEGLKLIAPSDEEIEAELVRPNETQARTEAEAYAAACEKRLHETLLELDQLKDRFNDLMGRNTSLNDERRDLREKCDGYQLTVDMQARELGRRGGA